MTVEEFTDIANLKVGDSITTNSGSVRKLNGYSKDRKGLRFLGISRLTKDNNTINKIIYLDTLTTIQSKMAKNGLIHFSEITKTIAPKCKSMDCRTHIVITLISDYLKWGTANYKAKNLESKII